MSKDWTICRWRWSLILAGSLLLSAVYQAWAGAPTDQLRAYVDQVIKILEDPTLKDEPKATERRTALRKVANDAFDFAEISKRSLARHWQGRTPQKREEFVRLFEDLLEHTYFPTIGRPGGPRVSPFRTPPHIEALVLRVRQERQYGIPRLRLYLRRYHQVALSVPTIRRILREHRMPPVSLKRFRPGPASQREILVPGQSVQVDVKHLKTQSGRLYQFTAIDEATRYRVLKIYDHNSIQSAIAFLEAVRQALPVAIQRVQTDHGSEFGTDFTWHLHDLGIAHRRIPPGCQEANGKVERSHRTDEDEFYRRATFRTRHELVQKLRAWEHEYNYRRLHMGIGGRHPPSAWPSCASPLPLAC